MIVGLRQQADTGLKVDRAHGVIRDPADNGIHVIPASAPTPNQAADSRT
jgi:hypothetical protein